MNQMIQLLNVIIHINIFNKYINKYNHAKDPYGAKYQFLINKRESAG